ncbi:hypothetical protein AB0M36_34255 [Actinoplanes sp. NPDC051346]|uniref:hypothetical protein n=1 Tax=Actinoplanes sp. NPDC051346 TaxID=3155048 RepID=UPI0034123F89
MTLIRFAFFASAGLQTTALFLDRRLVPYCGTFAMAALLAMALSSPNPAGVRRWTRHAAIAGLSLLTLIALLSGSRTVSSRSATRTSTPTDTAGPPNSPRATAAPP